MKLFIALCSFIPACAVTALAAFMEYDKSPYWGWPFAASIFLWICGLGLFDKKT